LPQLSRSLRATPNLPVEVNEAGTEAAATAVVMGAGPCRHRYGSQARQVASLASTQARAASASLIPLASIASISIWASLL
jgi:hypothetical protein